MCKIAMFILLSSLMTSTMHAQEAPDLKAPEDVPVGKAIEIDWQKHPTCFIEAELPANPTAESAVTLKIVANGFVKRAILDTVDVKVSEGENTKKVYPWKLTKMGERVVDDLTKNPTAVYLAAVHSHIGTSSCVVFIGRNGTELPAAPKCQITANKDTGDERTLSVDVKGDVKQIFLNRDELDLSAPSKTIKLESSRNIIAHVKGPGGESACAYLFAL
jgi:hypothetical protein